MLFVKRQQGDWVTELHSRCTTVSEVLNHPITSPMFQHSVQLQATVKALVVFPTNQSRDMDSPDLHKAIV